MSAVDTAAPTTTPLTAWTELVAELPVGVLLQDEQGAVLAANNRAGDLLGLSWRDLVTGRRPVDWRACDDSGAPLPGDPELAEQVLRGGAPLSLPVVVVDATGRQARLWADYHPISAHGQARLLVLLHPVDTDVRQARGLLDPLTGLPGRVLLLDRLDQALLRSRTHGTLTSLVLVDICQLAAINTSYGFVRGDEVLTVMAGRLREGLRDDHTVARYRGDEFAVLAEHPNGTGEQLAERVRELATRPVPMGAGRLRPRVRVGWVTSDGAVPTHVVVEQVENRLRQRT
ncbi:GGDEF domain-containing protein [Goodfellowiella coeruleoviolacea]|uniref:Diguanylate cyclase (GGDEF) domain-containing protein n=1 Tax=Goodfellowiella coeruleoviolacea TaxID=334858 RepID=A0AAE3KI55_9PSEU|nr:GGDEF domain-containing protein [Goodfellowiella coeruleoviolacea]MCP2168921.1 diguanylate cyclase (GGDEF) domain-containing protein [Goodfellowiella coeruleoviolacea]